MGQRVLKLQDALSVEIERASCMLDFICFELIGIMERNSFGEATFEQNTRNQTRNERFNARSAETRFLTSHR